MSDSASPEAKPLRHLVSVWNPSYAADAMDAHLDVLLAWAERHARKEIEEEDVYVWWGKVRSANRLEVLPHRDDVLAIDEQCKAGRETHLYLTDYRSLYVGQVGEITAEDVVAETPRGERHGGRDRPGASSAQHALVIAAESRDSAICHVK